MAKYKMSGGNKNRNEEMFEEYLEQKSERRKKFWKRVGIIVVCFALVVAFCFPSVLSLLSK